MEISFADGLVEMVSQCFISGTRNSVLTIEPPIVLSNAGRSQHALHLYHENQMRAHSLTASTALRGRANPSMSNDRTCSNFILAPLLEITPQKMVVRPCN